MKRITYSPQIPEAFAFLFKPKRYKGVHGGRGGAKSESIARGLLKLGCHNPLKILCGREYQNSIKDSVKSLLDKIIRDEGLQEFYASTRDEIRGVNGTLFLFSGLKTNIESKKSIDGVDILWVEEAQTLSQNSLDVIIPTIRKDGSEIWFSYNRKDIKEPVHGYLTGHPDATVKHINYDQNPFFPEVLRKEMEWCKKSRPDDYGHIWLGEPKTISEAVVFSGLWVIEEFEPNNDELFKYGADWGFSQDPAALVRLYIRESEKRIYIDQETAAVGVPTKSMPQLFDRVPGARDWPIIADNARPEMVDYMCSEGFRVYSCKKGPGSVEAGIEWLRSYEIVIHPRCKEVQDEFRLYSYKVDKEERILPVLVDDHNHFIDAIRYACEDEIRSSGNAVVCV